MNTIIIALLSRLVNTSTIGGAVRGVVGPLFGFLAAWFAIKIPVVGPIIAGYFTEFNAGLVATAITGFIMVGWQWYAKKISEPTALETEKVMEEAKSQGLVTPAKAAEVITAVSPDPIMP